MVAQHQGLVGHVDLDRGVTLLDQRRHFLAEHLGRGIGDDQVDGVVDDRLADGLPAIRFDGGAQRFALDLPREGNQGRRPAAGRGNRGRVEVRAGPCARLRGVLLDVNVGVDPAGQDVLTGRVDGSRSIAQPVAQCGDLAVPDAHVANPGVGGRHHRATPDHEIEFRHARPPCPVHHRLRFAALRRNRRAGTELTRDRPAFIVGG